MGEKKRKRRESEAALAEGVPDDVEKSGKKKSKKARKDVVPALDNEVPSDVSQVAALVSPIATPMAGRKLSKKIFKLISHAAKEKAIRRGIKEVVLGMRKGETGIVVLAGDVFPIEVIAHVPLLCEEANIPYCYVGKKTELGASGLTKRPTSVVMISEKKAEGSLKEELLAMRAEVQSIQNLY